MWANKFVISISGHGECGKDTAAPFFSRYLSLNYQESTSACVVDPWWDEIQKGVWSVQNQNKPEGMAGLIIEPDDYPTKQAFHEDRRNRRMDWVAYIEYFNNSYGTLGVGLYAKAVEDGNQILTGIRRTAQFERCLEHVIDVPIWINRPGIKIDESQEYGPELCDWVIENDGTIDDLKVKCKEVSYMILTEIEYGKHTAAWIEHKLDILDRIYD